MKHRKTCKKWILRDTFHGEVEAYVRNEHREVVVRCARCACSPDLVEACLSLLNLLLKTCVHISATTMIKPPWNQARHTSIQLFACMGGGSSPR
jgi:hypothetical protein